MLVEKDYWIMHCLYGLQQLERRFELNGDTSLSKGYGIINRFSEDIDIRIRPLALNANGTVHHQPAAYASSDTHIPSSRRYPVLGADLPIIDAAPELRAER